MAFWYLILLSVVSSCLAGTSDIASTNLKTSDGKEEIAIPRDTPTRIELRMLLKNLGPDNLSQSPKNLDNFVFRVEIVEQGNEGAVNDYKIASSNNVDMGLFVNEQREIDLETEKLTITSAQCNKNMKLCACTKPAKNVVPPQQVQAYEDTNVNNDVTCMPISCSDGSSSSGDPHIIVYGKSEANPLCFDIFGYPGRQFIMLNDTVGGWGMYASSLDDKYFHIVVVETRTSHVTIDTRGVPNTGLTWKTGGEAQLGDITVAHDPNSKKMKVTTGTQDRRVVFAISLEKHSISTKHLDIQVEEHRILDENVGGLLGHAKKNYVGSQNPVQDMAYGAVKIADRYFGARLAQRGNKNCWLVSPEEALYPYTSEMFLVPDDDEDMSLTIV